MTAMKIFPRGRRQQGVAAVEFALVLPFLLMMAVPVFDLARIVQGDMILTNLSREGANLASRSSQDPQTIMTALAMTTPPLDMAANGSIYISKIMGNASKTSSSNTTAGPRACSRPARCGAAAAGPAMARASARAFPARDRPSTMP